MKNKTSRTILASLLCLFSTLAFPAERSPRCSTVDTPRFFDAKRKAAARTSPTSTVTNEQLLKQAQDFFASPAVPLRDNDQIKNRLIDLVEVLFEEKAIPSDVRNAACDLLTDTLGAHPDYVPLLRRSQFINEKVKRFLGEWDRMAA